MTEEPWLDAEIDCLWTQAFDKYQADRAKAVAKPPQRPGALAIAATWISGVIGGIATVAVIFWLIAVYVVTRR
jgi:hypothetical protein